MWTKNKNQKLSILTSNFAKQSLICLIVGIPFSSLYANDDEWQPVYSAGGKTFYVSPPNKNKLISNKPEVVVKVDPFDKANTRYLLAIYEFDCKQSLVKISNKIIINKKNNNVANVPEMLFSDFSPIPYNSVISHISKYACNLKNTSTNKKR